MNLGFKDILIYGVLALAVALGANHYLDLNIKPLDDLEHALSGSGSSSDSSSSNYSLGNNDYGSTTDEECARSKVSGDARMMTRKAIAQAKEDKDMDKLAELEEKWEEMDRQDREACN